MNQAHTLIQVKRNANKKARSRSPSSGGRFWQLFNHGASKDLEPRDFLTEEPQRRRERPAGLFVGFA